MMCSTAPLLTFCIPQMIFTTVHSVTQPHMLQIQDTKLVAVSWYWCATPKQPGTYTSCWMVTRGLEENVKCRLWQRVERFPVNNLPNLASFRHQAKGSRKQIPPCVLWRSETKGTAMRCLQERTMVAFSWTMRRCSQLEKVISCTCAYVMDSSGLWFMVQLQKATHLSWMIALLQHSASAFCHHGRSS